MKRVFIDSNVFCYVHDSKAPTKQQQAIIAINDAFNTAESVVISTQVLQEFYNTVTQKFRMPPADAGRELRTMKRGETVSISPEIVFSAADLHAKDSISFWDALIVAAAQAANCDELWSEDLQEGRAFGKLRVVNPFKI